ncbi:ligase-associated DNA damage response endonuclease PdeM [Aequorivita xiaoshiensis]|uniref:Ligase-associated DNA damage response endonuclease PdeM n=1 Tax=Aequorivita xiaoshiensis TaxID=2874476 RepID=A0A9X1R0G2_9FLAO|nr:ligase-associated DNA damage response endonuclease PdeM [Aequorivita xiaoshiensis]MCG2430016.1 ligase-associated DNA damage response endonuclease PdeM [Aequorivita xiaoshiensis]
MIQTVKINNNIFQLHPSGSIYWVANKMLLIADVHLGKVLHFRKYGAAIPASAAYKNFETLTEVVNHFEPNTVCFLGDLFHSTLNKEWREFEKWVEYCNAKVILVSGNHDVIPQYLYKDLGVEVMDELVLDGFHLTHHPSEINKGFNFCGHVHPGIRMKGMGRQFVKLPCFYKTENQLILPAFGNFTGKYILTPTRKDEVFVIVEGEVICVSR